MLIVSALQKCPTPTSLKTWAFSPLRTPVLSHAPVKIRDPPPRWRRRGAMNGSRSLAARGGEFAAIDERTSRALTGSTHGLKSDLTSRLPASNLPISIGLVRLLGRRRMDRRKLHQRDGGGGASCCAHARPWENPATAVEQARVGAVPTSRIAMRAARVRRQKLCGGTADERRACGEADASNNCAPSAAARGNFGVRCVLRHAETNRLHYFQSRATRPHRLASHLRRMRRLPHTRTVYGNALRRSRSKWRTWSWRSSASWRRTSARPPMPPRRAQKG